MTVTEFDALLERRLRSIREVLASKANDYATTDRLHNFKSAGELGGPPAEVLWGYMLKHLVRLRDLAFGVKPTSPGVVNEVVGDAINYLILLEAVFLEKDIAEHTERVANL